VKNKMLFSLMLMLLGLHHAFSQTKEFETHEQLWLGYFNQIRLTSKSGIWAEGQLRLTDQFIKEPSLSILRFGYTHYLTDQSRVTAGYAYVTQYTSALNIPEHRPWQQIQWYEKKNWFTSMQWIRLEERYREKVVAGELTGEYNFNFRARYCLSLTIPLKGKQVAPKVPFAFVSNEVLINFGKNIVNNYFDQNRLFAGLGYQINAHLNAQAGYLYVFQQLPEGNKYININAIRLYVFHTLDLRSKD
jgi:hypothetical protein